jgi:hypothetical protein
MTRKDYIILAAALAAARSSVDALGYTADRAQQRRAGVDDAAEAIADRLAEDNPRFDRNRFLDVARGLVGPR